jgi:hypothetical protein
MFALGADSSPSKQPGRYQIASGGQASAVIVDTVTGQAWAFQPNNTSLWKCDEDFFAPKNQ